MLVYTLKYIHFISFISISNKINKVHGIVHNLYQGVHSNSLHICVLDAYTFILDNNIFSPLHSALAPLASCVHTCLGLRVEQLSVRDGHRRTGRNEEICEFPMNLFEKFSAESWPLLMKI